MVSPEPPDDTGQVFRKHALFLSSTRQCKQLPGIILDTEMEGRQVKEHTLSLTVKGKGILQNGAQAGILSGSPGQDLP